MALPGTPGERISDLCNDYHITQKELAKALSLPVTTLNGYVRGHREPDYETLQRFADYFGVSCDYLLDYSVNKENQTRLTALSAEEYRFIGVCRQLRADQRELLVEEAQFMDKQNKRRANKAE